ncbi:MAG: IS481 family transposase, partial [Peptoniphilaceae bacterium]|nr:IS481 family transposase [Peptoniphilaceae bacterium]
MTTSITKTQRYLPHTLETRFHAVKMYRAGDSLAFVFQRHKISKASLMRWNRRFDGTKNS